MKKILLLINMILFFFLFGCDFQIQTKKNKQYIHDSSFVEIDFQSFLLNDSGMGDLARSPSLIDIYYNFVENEVYSLYEVFIDYDKQTFIGIYMDNKTINKINDIYDDITVPPPLDSYCIMGFEGMLIKYREACSKPVSLIDKEEYPLYYYEFDNNFIPLENEDYQLVAVATKNEITFSELNGEHTYKSSLICEAGGSIDEEFFQAKSNGFKQNKTDHYLNCHSVIYSYYNNIEFKFIPIFPYNNKECIYERVWALSDGEDRDSIYEEYDSFIRKAIVKKNVYVEQYRTNCNIYDYEILKKLFLRKFYE